MVKITTKDQYRRTVQALEETYALIAKEEAYQRKFQRASYIAGLNRHADVLLDMIRECDQYLAEATNDLLDFGINQRDAESLISNWITR